MSLRAAEHALNAHEPLPPGGSSSSSAESKESEVGGLYDSRKTTEEEGYVLVNDVALFDSGTLHRKRDQNAGMSGVKLQVSWRYRQYYTTTRLRYSTKV